MALDGSGAERDGLPTPAGQSSWRIKGLAYRNLVESFRLKVPGGLERLLAALSPELRAFCEQPFMAASWYDALPMVPLTMHAARILGVPHVPYMRNGGRIQAGIDAESTHRSWLREATPETAVERHLNIGRRYYDFLEADSELTEGGARMRIHGLPRYFALWFVPMQEGYTGEILRIVGAPRPRVVARPYGTPGAAPLERVTVTFDIVFASEAPDPTRPSSRGKL